MLPFKVVRNPDFLRKTGPVLLLVAAVSVGTWAQAAAPKKAAKSQKPKAAIAEKTQPEQPAEAVAAPPPPTPEQMPARAPTVSYQNGQLSIVAPNSTLSDILQAVKSKTGASIDVPAGANERVVSRFGPGPARDVLAALLNGSHFNYVMIGSDANPTSVAQVILTPRVGGETGPVNQPTGQMNAGGMPQYPGQIMQPQPYPGGQMPGGQVAVQPAPGAVAPEDQPSPDTEEDDAAAQQQQDNEGAPEQANQGDGQDNNGQPQVKTPEQLLQELQSQQQQQQQQQQQPGNPPVQPPPQ
jgi:hypothetical protein